MDRFPRAVTAWMVGITLISVGSLAGQTLGERDVSRIRIEGLETISPQSVLKKLENLPEIFEASHLSIANATYVYRVREAVNRGMLSSGFFDAHVEVVSESDPLTLMVDEGPRIRCGSISVEGGTQAVNQWVKSQLQVAAADEEDAKPVWVHGKPAVGTLFGSMNRSNEIQERLEELGLQGSDADVEFHRNEQTHEQELQVQLATEDASFEIPVVQVAETPASEPQPVSEQPASQAELTGLAAELQSIHQRLFAKPTAGIRFRGVEATITTELWFGERVTVAKVEQDSHVRNFVFADGSLMVSMSEPPAAISVPIPNGSVVLSQRSVAESDDGKTMSFTINGAFSSDQPEQSTRFGAVYTSAAWTEWFPPDATERTNDKNGVTYSFQDHQLRLDHNGQLIELVGSDPAGRQFQFTAVSEDEIQAIANEIRNVVEPIEMFVREPGTGKRTTLSEIFHHFTDGDDTDKDEFKIPPASGQRDLFGVLILAAVNDGRLVDPNSMMGRLSKLYALELSRNRRGLPERITELEPEALQGPVTSAVLADLLARHGNIDQALRHYRHSQRLLADPTAVQHDVQILVASTNLFGRVCEQVDVKEWLQQSTQLAAPWLEDAQMAFAQGFVALLPDATNRDERLANAARLATLAYELGGRTILDQKLTERIQTLEAYQQRLAKKKESKEKSKR